MMSYLARAIAANDACYLLGLLRNLPSWRRWLFLLRHGPCVDVDDGVIGRERK